jgi:hypothetical protein
MFPEATFSSRRRRTRRTRNWLNLLYFPWRSEKVRNFQGEKKEFQDDSADYATYQPAMEDSVFETD